MFTQSISINVIYYFYIFYLHNVVRGTCYSNVSTVRSSVTPGIVSKRVNLS